MFNLTKLKQGFFFGTRSIQEQCLPLNDNDNEYQEQRNYSLQVTPPMPAAVPQHDPEDTAIVAYPWQPHGEARHPRVFELFAPKVHHILRHILQVDPETLDVALSLEQAGIYNNINLCMFSDCKVDNFNVNKKNC